MQNRKKYSISLVYPVIKLIKSFGYAARGLWVCLKERNFRIHIVAAIAVIYFGAAFYELSRVEWALLSLTIGAVMSLEAVNTAIEYLCNRVTPDKHPLIACCKDCAAAAVLIAAIAAVGVAVALFWDVAAFMRIYEYFCGNIVAAVALAAAVVLCIAFIFLPEVIKNSLDKPEK